MNLFKLESTAEVPFNPTSPCQRDSWRRLLRSGKEPALGAGTYCNLLKTQPDTQPTISDANGAARVGEIL